MSQDVIHYPLMTEKAMNVMDFDNKLQFVVDTGANKPSVSEAVESQFDVTVENVNTQMTMQGEKKATVTLSDDDDAQEIASRIGVF
jgi:large subunit ribosomal protein L23